MAFWMGASALLMALLTNWNVANMWLSLGAALAGVLAIASREIGSSKLAARILARRDRLRRWRGARCGTVYWVIVTTSLNELILTWPCMWHVVQGSAIA